MKRSPVIMMITLVATAGGVYTLKANSVNNDAVSESLRRSRIVSESFQLKSAFKPAELLLGNCHVQTIVGSEVVRARIFGFPKTYTSTRKRFETDDGDFFYADFTHVNQEGDTPVVVVLHGLESNPDGPLVIKMAEAFHDKGFTCCLVAFRGCTGEENQTPGAYHVGFTKDVKQVTQYLKEQYPNKKIYLSGFSLGGNVALKYLGELGEKAEAENIGGAAVACVPFDPVQSHYKLDAPGFSRIVYSGNFLATLKKKAEYQHARFPGAFDIEAVRQCTTIGEFDDAFIAKIYGFRDKIDYYRQSGSKWWLNRIRVPSVAINARDDPFIEESSLPDDSDLLIPREDLITRSKEQLLAPVKLIYTNNGGHCGYLSSLWSPRSVPSWGWLAEELSRALKHIHEQAK